MGSTETLRAVLDAGRDSKRLDELSGARVIGKVARQVHAAQQKAGAGKSVGPVTPSHIQLATSGEVTLALGDGAALGYSAPEQIAGASGDRRSDVFSLGAVLWETLTYQRLFDAMNDAAVKVAVQEREIQPPAEVNANIPAELSAICMRALSRNPTDRYQSLKAMAVELEEFLEEAGYADDDTQVASYLATLAAERRSAVAGSIPSMSKPASSTQPPPASLRPAAAKAPVNGTAQPTMLGAMTGAAGGSSASPAAEPRPKTSSGAALAAALANAGSGAAATAIGMPAAPSGTGLPAAASSATAIGVPAAPNAAEWQDRLATLSPAKSAAASTAATPSVPLVPLPPILPSGSTPPRNDKSTISVAVPPQVKVATTVEAKHEEAPDLAGSATIASSAGAGSAALPKEALRSIDATHAAAKPAAIIVEDKPQAVLIDEPAATAPPAAPQVASEAATKAASTAPEPATLVDAPQPSAQAIDDTRRTLADSPGADDRATVPAKVRAPSRSDATPVAAASEAGSAPHPADVVSLPGPAGRESKDVLAGWGWGTDKHDAIAPSGYAGDDEPYAEPSSRKPHRHPPSRP